MELSLAIRRDALDSRAAFEKHGRVRLQHFLDPRSATALHRAVLESGTWRTFVLADQQLLTSAPLNSAEYVSTDEQDGLNRAYAAAQYGFAAIYDADSYFSEDLEE